MESTIISYHRDGLGIRATLIVFLICVWLLSGITPALAAGTTTVEATVTFSGPKPNVLPAGDDKAHLVGLGQKSGKAVFSDGRNAKYSNVFFMDWYQGKSMSVWGYTKMIFKDDYWLYFKWDSEFAGRDQAGKPIFKGDGTILKGTGPYQGIKGEVKFQNRPIPPNKEYPEGATEAKAVFTYTLP